MSWTDETGERPLIVQKLMVAYYCAQRGMGRDLVRPRCFEGDTMNAISKWTRVARGAVLAGCLAGIFLPALSGKDKPAYLDPNDPTLRFFQLADNSKGGKVTELYVVAGVYRDPAAPDEDAQQILKVDYDKTKVFGKLQIVVRSVGKIHPDQMKAYSAKDFFGFGLSDQVKFIKTEAGPFGKPGDMYLHSMTDRPLSSSPITDEVRKSYETLVTDHLLPALEKK